jgi:hypothetical protein
MKSLDLAVVPPTEKTTLNGVPRPRPPTPPLDSRLGVQVIRELRRLQPLVNVRVETEYAFLEKDGLKPFKCLEWLRIAKQFYDSPATFYDSASLRKLPPIAFLKLLIEWIDDYARITGRKRNKGLTWRSRALRGFVHDNRRLQSRKFLINVTRLARSIAAHFLNPPFHSHLLVLWGDWHRWRYAADARCSSSGSTPADLIERGRHADRLFAVLMRFRNGGKVSADDHQTLKPFLSKRFQRPFWIDALHDKREHISHSEFIARAAATDVYLQYRDMIEMTSSLRDYVEQVSAWAAELCEDEIRLNFELIHWRFCGCPVYVPSAPKKTYAVSA